MFNGFVGTDDAEPTSDASETVQISSLALLKMLKHGRAGIPLEVMGLMLGEFVDEYTVKVVDVFAMPQSGTNVTVESVDPIFQTEMMNILKATGRHETVVGWYHSHPGFGCWLSTVDISTQQSFEKLCKRAVAVVVDPIQSVKGKVVIDAFRLIDNQLGVLGGEPRQVTSNIGYLKTPTLISIIHGLNKHYYSFNITCRKNDLEQKMLLNLHRKTWADNLKLRDVREKRGDVLKLIESYGKACEEEKNLTGKNLDMARVGKVDYRRRLLEKCEESIMENTIHNLLYSIHRYIFNQSDHQLEINK
ncbi:proteasome regulatory subunit [Encephalitozoon hellem ATCC 50504]|uniref:26S proteasome regulatory subunit RPN14 n=1 Tax=Encephalitozoon hellem TaxID=27973 RepID=A0A9Q9C526_ENCHE|nr:proteasome regulatory subunit [Encephalitozoon hellem ATCC 50504]AFM99318.1 proteasome regulatory subunit [Encephalitozoon hellem ATCC 50504]UTX44321.1 26S proteasome regulatory subunit RPN14 [Encephalitozoon hellem]|eukprot:XP_003888299.1 proteasome regulatory subunit [Encephalitozoon hellem ATCC 50504]